MAIPPVVSNFPSLNLFRSDRGSSDGNSQSSETTSSDSQDLVEISDAALERLQGDQQIAAENEALQVAQNTQDILSENESLTLGLDTNAIA